MFAQTMEEEEIEVVAKEEVPLDTMVVILELVIVAEVMVALVF
jgi:hypothetical protein